MSELLIGCGQDRLKRMSVPGRSTWNALTTLDNNEDHNPDVLHDLEVLPYPFDDGEFNEIHAYCVLEHCGRQGDWRYFFGQWSEFYRMLKRDGLFFGMVPRADSRWVWGDPSHTRAITLDQLSFLSQDFYEKMVGKSAASDFRHVWKGNFELVHSQVKEERQCFVLRKL